MNQQSEQVTLAAERRAVLGKHVKQLRRQGRVPGVMYGHGFEAIPLQFENRSLSKLLSHVSGSQLVSIQVAGQKEPEMALVRDVQRDPIRGDVLHVDFYRVEMTERLTAEIPLTLVGESLVISQHEGILIQGISAIEVECLPGDLVDEIAVDLSDLEEIGQGVYVRDLAIPSGIDVLTDKDEMIVRVVAMAEEEEIVVEEEVLEVKEVEVITEAKEEEEGEE
ncbi:MAG: 50S ribosomal protein L25 [Anaerolineae bacterium]|nr:50S ribosomal protein L25 [Anaerolineae bacterium]